VSAFSGTVINSPALASFGGILNYYERLTA